MGSRVHLWRWSYRWFRPLQKEEFRADITPARRAGGLQPRNCRGRRAARCDRGRGSCPGRGFPPQRAFIATPARSISSKSPKSRGPTASDRVFTWKERDFNLHDATNRVEVTLLGNEVAGYREYLKVPDQWKRDYQRLRSKNEVASTVDSAVMFLLLVGLIIVIVMRVRGHDIRWQQAAWIGMIGMALSFCSSLNQMPLEQFNYPTTDSYASFMLRQLLQSVVAALGAGGLLFVLAAGAEPLVPRSVPRPDLAGQSLRGARPAHQTLPARRRFWGSRSPESSSRIRRASTSWLTSSAPGRPPTCPIATCSTRKFPWLFVLFGGFLPAVSEEFLFRMFGIPFVRKLVRSTAAAIVIAGFVWGFGHAAYPQQPFYIRGVEVGIGGVALGLIMLRWGILPTLVWHYSVDAMYSAMLLLRSQSLYFKLSGAASAGIVVLPVLLALAAYWRRGGFEPETGLLNADEAAPAEAPKEIAAAPRGVLCLARAGRRGSGSLPSRCWPSA